jgi:hypothetical protein
MTYRPRNAVALCLDYDYSTGEWDREEEPGRCSHCSDLLYPGDEVDDDGMCVACVARFAALAMDHGTVSHPERTGR